MRDWDVTMIDLGRPKVSVSIDSGNQPVGDSISLTPAEAREMAQALLAAAEEAEAS